MADESTEIRPTPVLSVAAPVYNEEEGIEAVVRYWKTVLDRIGQPAEIVLCNDGSSDGTAAILERLRRDVPELRVVGGSENHGYGSALSTAIGACTGELIATLDSDGQFDLADIEKFLPLIAEEGCDGVTGRRVHKRDSPARVLADRCLNLLVRAMFGTRLRDTNCALKLVRRDLLQSLQLDATGFAFPTEVVLKLEAAGARVAECPVRHLERATGGSKLRVVSTGWRMLRFLLYLRHRLWLYRAGLVRLP